jgi:hypothetical protein
MYVWLDKNAASDRKPGMTDEQFYYKARKNAIGAFKSQIYALTDAERSTINLAWEAQFAKLFQLLGMKDTRKYVERFVRPVRVQPEPSLYVGKEIAAGTADDLQD